MQDWRFAADIALGEGGDDLLIKELLEVKKRSAGAEARRDARASSTLSSEQQARSPAFRLIARKKRSVAPQTAAPCRLSSSRATDESTPRSWPPSRVSSW
jgi:hypothetical protein